MRAKVWRPGTDAEPDWMISGTDTAWGHGAFGFRATVRRVADGFRTYYQPIAVEAWRWHNPGSVSSGTSPSSAAQGHRPDPHTRRAYTGTGMKTNSSLQVRGCMIFGVQRTPPTGTPGKPASPSEPPSCSRPTTRRRSTSPARRWTTSRDDQRGRRPARAGARHAPAPGKLGKPRAHRMGGRLYVDRRQVDRYREVTLKRPKEDVDHRPGRPGHRRASSCSCSPRKDGER